MLTDRGRWGAIAAVGTCVVLGVAALVVARAQLPRGNGSRSGPRPPLPSLEGLARDLDEQARLPLDPCEAAALDDLVAVDLGDAAPRRAAAIGRRRCRWSEGDTVLQVAIGIGAAPELPAAGRRALTIRGAARAERADGSIELPRGRSGRTAVASAGGRWAVVELVGAADAAEAEQVLENVLEHAVALASRRVR